MLTTKEVENSPFINRRVTFVKVTAIFGFLAIFLINLIILLNPALGYELSIYDAMPSIIWYFLIISSLCGVSIIVYEVYTKHFNYSNAWIYGLFILIISRISLLWLPYNRGYVAWQWDHLTHIGIIHDILVSGFTAPDNFYPITHILLSQMALLLNISSDYLTTYPTAFLSVFFLMTIYLIGTFLGTDKRATLLALAATGCVIFSRYDVNLTPNGWSILFFPFALLIVLKTTDLHAGISYKILAVIILIIMPFFHTLSALLLTIIILLLAAIHAFLNRFGYFRNKIQKHFFLPDKAPSLELLGVISISWVVWTLSFEKFYANLQALFLDVSSDVLAEMGSQISKMELDILEVILLVIKEEGDAIIFLILFAFGSYFAYSTYHKRQEFKRIFAFIFVTLFFCFIYASYLFNIVTVLDLIEGSRILAYVKIMTPIFVGFLFLYLLSKKKLIYVLLCVGIMMITVTLSIFGTFASPIVDRPTPQITQMDMYGMEWSLKNKDFNDPYIEITCPPYRFADAIFGMNYRMQRSDIEIITEKVPNHFNYPNKLYFGENYPSDRYFVLTMFDKIIYLTVYLPVGRFNENDFIRLKNDPSVEYLYNNGECDVYYINAYS